MSVVIPAYNARDTLSATLDTVRSQTYRELEIIVVDDGSTDDTAELVRRVSAHDARVRLLQQENQGVAAARNLAISSANGPYIAPIDADDLWHPRKIELQMQVFRKSAVPLGFVYAWSRRIDEHGFAMADQGEPDFQGNVFPQLLAYNFLNNASVAIFRRDSLIAIGGFDTSMQRSGAHGAEDLALALAIAEREPIGVAPCYLVGYRQIPGTMSADGLRMRRSMEIVLSEMEDDRPDLPASLFQLGRMHADLYASGLALNKRDWPLFGRLLASGCIRSPNNAVRLLGCAMLWRTRDLAGLTRSKTRFLDLQPHERLPALPFQRWLDSRRARVVRGIVSSHGKGLSGSRTVDVR